MLKRLIENLNKRPDAVSPQQGRRLKITQDFTSDETITISGTRLPGFFIIFGLMFSLPWIGIIAFFTGNIESESGSPWFLPLFLLPFVCVGSITLFIGLFNWLGRTEILIQPETVKISRILFGWTFQQKIFARNQLQLGFEESHKSNNVPVYKIAIKDHIAKNKIGIGGSLKEAELKWLDQTLRQKFHMEVRDNLSIRESIDHLDTKEIEGTSLQSTYRSKQLTITPTMSGWKAQNRKSLLSSLLGMIFGGIFISIAAFFYEPSRSTLIEWYPALGEQTSEMDIENIPPLFALVFGGMGGLFALISLLSGVAYSVSLELRNDQLTLKRTFFGFGSAKRFSISEISELHPPKAKGETNSQPRYALSITTGGRVKKLFYFLPKDDALQIYGRLKSLVKR